MSQTVLITGCTTGSAGHALAKEYHARGLRVFACSRRVESMADLEAAGIELVQLDVTDASSVKAARDLVQSRSPDGSLDILVNCAGIAGNSPAVDEDIEAAKRIYETNVFGVMRMVQEFFPLLLKSSKASIWNIGSVVAYLPIPFGSTYNSSKAALHSYSDTLRLELAPFNIKVVTVVLGGVKSNIFGYPKPPMDPKSLYLPIQEEMKIIRKNAETATPVSLFAKKFVTQSLRRNPSGHFNVAKGSTMFWYLTTFLPRFILETMFYKLLGLGKLATIVKEEKKKTV